MRIGIDAREIEDRPTGVGRVVLGLLRAWPDLDDLELICRRPPAIDLPRRCGLTVAPGPRWMPGAVWEQVLLPAVLRRLGVDALLAPGYGMPRFAGRPTAVCMHDCAPFARPFDFAPRERMRRRLAARVAARHASFLFMGSRFAADEACRHLEVSEERLLVVPWGLDEGMAIAGNDDTVADRYALPQRSILFVGAGLCRRALGRLADQVGRLARDRPGLELLLTGPAPDPTVSARPGVRWLGYVKEADLPSLYRAATLVAYPSAYEGFGLPVLEALACGVPVVASATSALAEVYEGRAVLVPHDDDAAWCAAMGRLLDDPAEREHQVERGHAWARTQSWEPAAGEVRAQLAASVGARP